MSIYYCNTCQKVFLPKDTLTDGTNLICHKCKSTLKNLGSEEGSVTLKAHIESKSLSEKLDINPYSIIQSKHYKLTTKDKVLIECEEQLSQNPLNVIALFTLSQWYYSKNMVNESIAIAKQILSIDPNYEAAHLFLTNLEKPKEASVLSVNIKTLEAAVSKLVSNNQLNNAKPYLKQILSINNRHPGARRYLAEIYTINKQYEKAIHELNILNLQFPTDVHILFNLAVASYNCNNITRAKSNLKEAMKLCKNTSFKKEIENFLNHILSTEEDTVS